MSTTAAADVAWDLEPLVGGKGADGARAQLDEAQTRADAFAAAYVGKLGEMDGQGLAAAMGELAQIAELVGRAGNYASLCFSVDTADPEVGALMQHVSERAARVETALVFFDLEWAAIDDARAEELLQADGLELCRHHLRTMRRYRPHLLSEPEEILLTEKSVTGAGAWTRLFSELTSAIDVALPGTAEPVKLDVALSHLLSGDREQRAIVQQAVTEALAPGLRTRGFVFNTLLQDKAIDDRLRTFPTWLTSRNLSNEASDESVQALVEAVKDAYEIPRRWYRLKARLLGLERLADYDRMAAVSTVAEEFEWDDAKRIVLEAYHGFSPVLGNSAEAFFDGHIDAPVRPAKRGGAFCAYAVPAVHPYVMLNYTSKRNDVLTLAHELGHGVHASLARPRGIFEQHTPLTLAETASVFGETLVFNDLLAQAKTPESRLSLLAEAIEGSIATVFRQTAMNQFEQLVHTARREEGELSTDRFGELWALTQTDLMGDAVEITENYRSWWSYIPHFIGSPGYVYAYAYGQLLALSVYGRYQEVGDAFVDSYVELLSAGGSKSPEQLAAIAGLDLNDTGFWQAGLKLVESQLDQAEAAAEAVIAARKI